MAKQFITVGEIIVRLSAFDLDLPVAISDWQERCQVPSAAQAAKIEKYKGQFLPMDFEKDDLGRAILLSREFVVIGDNS